MLVNLSPSHYFRSEIQRQRKCLRELYNDDKQVKRNLKREITFNQFFNPTGHTGVYWSSCDESAINNWCKQNATEYKFHKKAQKMREQGISGEEIYKKSRNSWSFGVADNIEQIIECYNRNEDGFFKGNHVIFVKKIIKGHNGGWRWHKWGAYIGTQNPHCEYLDDEPEINEVLIFSIYKVI